MEKKILYPQLVARYQAALEDHRHAVNLLRERDKEITRLRGLNLSVNRQNKRLSIEARKMAARLLELDPAETDLSEILYPKD